MPILKSVLLISYQLITKHVNYDSTVIQILLDLNKWINDNAYELMD